MELKTKVSTFMSVGPRFTAKNGQALCERVQELELAAGIVTKPCGYYSISNEQK